MKLFFQYCSFGFSNCYVLGAEYVPHTPVKSKSKTMAAEEPLPGAAGQTDAIIVDPGSMGAALLECIETNNFNLRAVLITHEHLGHVHGLRTLKRIYDVDVFAMNRLILDHKTTIVRDGDKISIGPFTVEVISIPGHSADSVVYLIDSLLFTGDVLTAGLVGRTDSAYGAATQINKLRSRLLSLPGDYTVLPGHGPPSTLEAERRFNTGITQDEQRKNRKPSFRLHI
ncbi:MAG: MBL fold metallo-hydrolase [Treponema sp.]|jgi:glyoxylase-like metal-dependent hydrolase (beta-lactamase superfamily II)|nr:MBL fold metallo-hydrolase [Treponema sp.]